MFLHLFKVKVLRSRFRYDKWITYICRWLWRSSSSERWEMSYGRTQTMNKDIVTLLSQCMHWKRLLFSGLRIEINRIFFILHTWIGSVACFVPMFYLKKYTQSVKAKTPHEQLYQQIYMAVQMPLGTFRTTRKSVTATPGGFSTVKNIGFVKGFSLAYYKLIKATYSSPWFSVNLFAVAYFKISKASLPSINARSFMFLVLSLNPDVFWTHWNNIGRIFHGHKQLLPSHKNSACLLRYNISVPSQYTHLEAKQLYA